MRINGRRLKRVSEDRNAERGSGIDAVSCGRMERGEKRNCRARQGEGSVNEFPEKRRGLEIPPRGVIITSGTSRSRGRGICFD